jgi:hypothetical protein
MPVCIVRLAIETPNSSLRGRVSSWIWTAALGITLCCGAFVPAAALADYQIVGDSVFPSDRPEPTVSSLKAISNGGYLIVGQNRLSEVRLIKTFPSGEKQWEQVSAARVGAIYAPSFAIEADNGGYWVVGRLSELEFMSEDKAKAALKTKTSHQFNQVAFIAKFDSTGNLEWRQPLGLNEIFYRSRFVCGARTSDGLMLVGTKPRYYDSQPPSRASSPVIHPWVVKLDERGSLVSQTFIADDGEGLLSATVANARYCSGPYVDKNGSVTFGMQLNWHPTYMANGVRIVTGSGTEDKSLHSYLVARVNSDGKELARALFKNESPGFLLQDGAGFLLVTNPVPARTSGIRRTWLDQKLTVQRTAETNPPGYSLVLQAGSLGTAGAIHIVGQFSAPSEGKAGLVIVNLSPLGELKSLRAVAPRPWGWRLEGHAVGAVRDETAVVLRNDSTVRLLRFLYQD